MKSHPMLVNTLQIRDLFLVVESLFRGADTAKKAIRRGMHNFRGHVHSVQKGNGALVAQMLPC